MAARGRSSFVVAVLLLIALACYEYFSGSNQAPIEQVATEQSSDGFRTTAAKVVKVPDGDTLVVKVAGSNKDQRVRLLGVDAPELKMAGGRQSQKALQNMIRASGHQIQIVWRNKDQYGRFVGKVLDKNGNDLNLAQIAAGHAWVYRHYLSDVARADRSPYLEAEKQAQAQRLGLWSQPGAEPPWQWRKENPRQ